MRFVEKLFCTFVAAGFLSACGGGGGSGSFDSRASTPVTAASSATIVATSQASSSGAATSSSPATSSQSNSDAIDKQAPDIPVITLGTPIENGVYIAWGETSDNREVTQYRIFRNGAEVGRVAGSTQEFYDYDVYPNKAYTYTISAGDAAGNWSALNSVLVVTPQVLSSGALSSASSAASSTINQSSASAKSSSTASVNSSVASQNSSQNSSNSSQGSASKSSQSSSSTSSANSSSTSSKSSSASSKVSSTSSSAVVTYTFTKDNIPLLKNHPRTYITPTELDKRIALCAGASANAGCQPFFKTAVTDAVATAVANNQYLGLPDYLQYKATGDSNYLNRTVIAAQQLVDKAFAVTSNPLNTENLLTIDAVWESLDNNYKLKFLETIQRNDYFQYASHKVGRNTTVGYHLAITMNLQLAAALILWDDPILKDSAVTSNPTKYAQWNPEDFIYAMQYQATAGDWVKTENYLAGDSPLNTGLPGGAKGGLYDHFGYDNGEESNSVMINLLLKNSTGQNYHLNNQRDANKGYFWQALRLPHDPQQVNLWAYSFVDRMTNSLQLAYLYQNPRLKYFAKALIEGPDYGFSKIQAILYYDFANTIPVEGPETLPTAIYFNGGGFVMSRSDWSNSAAYGLFISGEHISRRYDDVNSFTIHRKSTITGIAGARIRFNDINERHHFYARLSASKNTLKVCDPNETVDYTVNRAPMAAGTGKKIDPNDNFCGQIPDGYTLTATDKTQTGSKTQLDINNVQNMGDITRYESLPGKYTYAVGDGKFHYASKVKKFERSFVHLLPADYIIFDRVETAKPEFKTSVLVHNFDEPVAKRAADKTGEGVREWQNENEFVVNNGLDKASFQTLLPTTKTTKIRGGTTLLLNNASLGAGSTTPINYNTTAPRFLEFSGYDPADYSTLKNTQITIKGDSLSQNNDTEVISFIGDAKEKFLAFSSNQGARTTTSLTTADTKAVWKNNQWVGWLTAKTATSFTPVVSNTGQTLTADFSGPGFWQLQLFKYHANTTKQWKRIESISVNKNLAGVDLGFSHYFDAENVNGDTYTFMPYTDAKADTYRKPVYVLTSTNYGTHTMEVFDDAATTKHNFLTVVRLGDPTSIIAEAKLLQGDKFAGALVGSQLVLFAKEEIFAGGDTNVDLNSENPASILITDLTPNQSYYLSKSNGKLFINTIGAGQLKVASAQGTLQF